MISSVKFSNNKHTENIGSLFKTLYNDEQLADVTLCCKDGTIKAHKVILSANSTYFHKIFQNHSRDQPIFIMYGISYKLLHNIIELIYKGEVEVPVDSIDSLSELANELQLIGFCRNHNVEEPNIVTNQPFVSLNRLAVEQYNKEKTKQIPDNEELNHQKEAPQVEVLNNQKETQNNRTEVSSLKLSKKKRKFKCDICSNRFKRAAHLSRHQLVHTGERPFQCFHCDKAFSRHDKLKEHISKSHEDEEHQEEPSDISDSEGPPNPKRIRRTSRMHTSTVKARKPHLNNDNSPEIDELNDNIDYNLQSEDMSGIREAPTEDSYVEEFDINVEEKIETVDNEVQVKIEPLIIID